MKINRITVTRYEYELPDLSLKIKGFDTLYSPGSRQKTTGSILTKMLGKSLLVDEVHPIQIAHARFYFAFIFLLIFPSEAITTKWKPHW